MHLGDIIQIVSKIIYIALKVHIFISSNNQTNI